jgi:carbon-monoxide dehydrogenase large subunit
MVPARATMIGAGPYAVERLHVSTTAVVTNTAPTGPYRGAGRPEAAMALERTIDEYARRIGIDPVEVRRRNLVPVEEMPYTTPTGATYDGGDYRLALDKALGLIGLDEMRDLQRDRRDGGGNPVGVGVACFVDPAGGGNSSGEFGRVEVDPDGNVWIRTGSTSAGQSHSATWRRVVAEIFDLDPASIRFVSGDTDAIRDGGGTYGSRSTQLGAVAAVRVGRRVVDQAKALASEMLEVSAADVWVRDGGFEVVGVPDARIELRVIGARAGELGAELAAEELYSPGAETFPYGTHAAAVEVDRETGLVTILRVAAVDDCGRILDPIAVDGQLRGGFAQAIGQALFEEVRYRDDGQLMSASLMDYQVPRATDVPPVAVGKLTTPADNELGVKGAGEAGVIGLPAAVLNAVCDALGGDPGVTFRLPLRPARVWETLRTLGT